MSEKQRKASRKARRDAFLRKIAKTWRKQATARLKSRK